MAGKASSPGSGSRRKSSGEVLEGVVERVVFRNRENGWTVLRLTVEDRPLLQTVVGSFQEIDAGERVRFTGDWKIDPSHGRQFFGLTCLPLAPATLIGIEKFLGSGLIPGIGPVMAKRMVAKFGLGTLDMIESSPAKLAQVEGIGKVRAKSISKAMVAKREVKEVMVFLEAAGVTPAFSHRIYKRYGKQAIRVVSDNPYRLASDVRGIGFRSADKIAAHLGVPPNSPHRAEAGLLFVLEELASEGHVYSTRDVLIPRTADLLELDIDLLESALDRLALMGGIITAVGGEQLYLPRLHTAQEDAARNLARIVRAKGRALPLGPGEAVKRARKLSGIDLAPAQASAFEVMARGKVTVLTGGPGTGKTTLLKGLVAAMVDQKQSVALAAPTGRAARRMAQSTGRDARTIHRLLEFTPRTGGFERNRSNPLVEDVVVIDEVSMVDIELFAALLSAVKDDARLVLVGDPDQLPSVGPGTVIGDMLELDGVGKGGISVVRLTEIFRQARSSLIVTGAHEILAGREPATGERGTMSDFFVVERDEPEACLEVIKEMVSRRIPARFDMDPIADVQVLTPMHKGLLGAANLNEELQALLNPGDGGIMSRGMTYRVGDKVMQVRNNYNLEVFNGDIGTVQSIGESREWIEINFMERAVRYPVSELDQTTLAYACSIHKSQGSEYPAVVIPIHTQHFVMLQRNLLYTGMTRGKRLVVLVGSKRAIRLAVRNNDMSRRLSALEARVRELV